MGPAPRPSDNPRSPRAPRSLTRGSGGARLLAGRRHSALRLRAGSGEKESSVSLSLSPLRVGPGPAGARRERPRDWPRSWRGAHLARSRAAAAPIGAGVMSALGSAGMRRGLRAVRHGQAAPRGVSAAERRHGRAGHPAEARAAGTGGARRSALPAAVGKLPCSPAAGRGRGGHTCGRERCPGRAGSSSAGLAGQPVPGASRGEPGEAEAVAGLISPRPGPGGTGVESLSGAPGTGRAEERARPPCPTGRAGSAPPPSRTPENPCPEWSEGCDTVMTRVLFEPKTRTVYFLKIMHNPLK